MDNRNSVKSGSRFFLILLLVYLAASTVLSLFITSGSISAMWLYGLSAVFVSVPCMFVPSIAVFKKQGFINKKVGIKTILCSVFLLVGLYLLSTSIGSIASILIQLLGGHELDTPLPNMSEANPILTILFICFIPAVAEETMFRGVILNFHKSLGRTKCAVINGLLFGLMHANPSGLPSLFLIGYFLGLVAYDSESLYPGMIIHFLNNLVSLVLYMFMASDTSIISDSSLAQAEIPVWLDLLIVFGMLAVGIIITFFAYRLFKKSVGKYERNEEKYGVDRFFESDEEIALYAQRPSVASASFIVSIIILVFLNAITFMTYFWPVSLDGFFK